MQAEQAVALGGHWMSPFFCLQFFRFSFSSLFSPFRLILTFPFLPEYHADLI